MKFWKSVSSIGDTLVEPHAHGRSSQLSGRHHSCSRGHVGVQSRHCRAKEVTPQCISFGPLLLVDSTVPCVSQDAAPLITDPMVVGHCLYQLNCTWCRGNTLDIAGSICLDPCRVPLGPGECVYKCDRLTSLHTFQTLLLCSPTGSTRTSVSISNARKL